MVNESIRAAFERFWQHTMAKLADKSDINHSHSTSDLSDIDAYVNDLIHETINDKTENIANNKMVDVQEYRFYKHSTLVSVSFPNVTKIGDYGFYQCSTLATADIPAVTEIGNFAFKGCISLNFINASTTTTIGQGAFDECASLSSVNFANLQDIKPLTFRKCEALSAADFPAVTNIGTQAFYSSGITSLTLRSNAVCTLENPDAFYFTPIEDGVGYIYVPSNLVDSYKTADGWSVYANQIRAIA